MKYLKALAIFLAIQIVTASTMWIGGYDFDTRSSDIASLYFCSVFLGVWMGAIPIIFPSVKK